MAETIAEAVHIFAKAVNEKVSKLTTCDRLLTDRPTLKIEQPMHVLRGSSRVPAPSVTNPQQRLHERLHEKPEITFLKRVHIN